MKKLINTAATLFAAGLMLLGNATAGQTPAANPPQAPAAKTQQAPAAKAPAGAAAKTRQTPAAKSQTVLVLKTQKEKASYAVGLNVGKGLHRDGVDVDPNIVLRGLKDAMAGGKTLLTDEEARAVLGALQADLRKNREMQMQKIGEANKEEGEAFLAANKTKDGVVTLPSGLQYKVLQEGAGPKPTADDSVVCNYRGRLLNNKEFDSSYKRGQPATLAVNHVIKGWMEALQLMPVGSKWQVVIPAELGYGPGGAGADIGPNATLVFEVELLAIQPKGQ